MENQSYSNSSYSDSRNSTPRSREIDCDNQSWDEQPKRVKLMCSYGGKIQPRPYDNRLSYIGGETKILTVDRSINFRAFTAKLSGLCGSKSCVWFKYQLPGEDLDALISVTNDEDLGHMMLEYDRAPKPVRLRLFLWFMKDLNSVEESRIGMGGQALSLSEIQSQINELRRMQISGQEQVLYQHFSDGREVFKVVENMVPVQQEMPVYWQDQSQMVVGGYQVTAGGAGVEQQQQVYIIPAPGGVYQGSTNYGQMTEVDGQARTQTQAFHGTQRMVPQAYQEQQVYSSVPGLVVPKTQHPSNSLYAEGMSGPQLIEGGYAVAYDANGRQVYYSVNAPGGGVLPTYQLMPTASALQVSQFAAVNQEGNDTIPNAN